jgi:hypothetical protein
LAVYKRLPADRLPTYLKNSRMYARACILEKGCQPVSLSAIVLRRQIPIGINLGGGHEFTIALSCLSFFSLFDLFLLLIYRHKKVPSFGALLVFDDLKVMYSLKYKREMFNLRRC